MAALAPDRVMWIFGSPRSGSTWLTTMLIELTRGHRVDEPLIGAHLGVLLEDVLHTPVEGNRTVFEHLATRDGYFFSEATTDVWKPLLRELLLARFGVGVGYRGLVYVKEPNGSVAAPLLIDLLPESRLILLVRDGRDVVDSMLAAAQGGWVARFTGRDQDDRRGMLIDVAEAWVSSINASKQAFESLPKEQRILVTYEDLRADTAGQLRRICARFGLAGNVDVVAERNQFERIDDRHKGEQSFMRAATPGLWRDRFSADEIELLNEILGPTLEAFGYEV